MNFIYSFASYSFAYINFSGFFKFSPTIFYLDFDVQKHQIYIKRNTEKIWSGVYTDNNRDTLNLGKICIKFLLMIDYD